MNTLIRKSESSILDRLAFAAGQLLDEAARAHRAYSSVREAIASGNTVPDLGAPLVLEALADKVRELQGIAREMGIDTFLIDQASKGRTVWSDTRKMYQIEVR